MPGRAPRSVSGFDYKLLGTGTEGPDQVVADFKPRFVMVHANGVIAAGEAVSFDASDMNTNSRYSVIESAVSNEGKQSTVGVAVDAASAAGEYIRVQIGGRYQGAVCSTSAPPVQGAAVVAGYAAGEFRALAGTGAGEAVAVGIALTSESGGTFDILISDRGLFG